MRRPPRTEGRFDGFGVAAQRGIVAGRVDASALPRVADLLAPDGGAAMIGYRIAGSADAAGHPALEVTLSGTVPMTCQRCLRTFRWPVEQTSLLRLARDEGELARIDDEDQEHETLLADAPLDARALVEDELLLTLPFVPRCPEGQCAALDGATERSPAAETSSAFGALAALKQGTGKKARR